MISGTLTNINRYQTAGEKIFLGLQHLAQMDCHAETSSYSIADGVTVIVSEYSTRIHNLYQFEAHQRVIDIQYPLIGLERVLWSPLEGMQACSEYDPSGDRTWYEKPSHVGECIIGNGLWVIFFPEDAHNPQLAFNDVPQLIKKVTIKICL